MEKAALQQRGIGASDLIGLNFGGERTVTVKRSLLTQVWSLQDASNGEGAYAAQTLDSKPQLWFVPHRG